ncbi:hypothetical protein PCE1_003379 [Barthelona sp. PCE]
MIDGLTALLYSEDVDMALELISSSDIVLQHSYAMAEHLDKLIELFNGTFDQSMRQKLALIISQIYFALSQYHTAVEYALESGASLKELEQEENLNNKQKLYLQTVLGYSIDLFIKEKNTSDTVDPLLNGMVDNMFLEVLEAGRHESAIGLGLECRDAKYLVRVFNSVSDDIENIRSLVHYVIEAIQLLDCDQDFRNEVLVLCIEKLFELIMIDPIPQDILMCGAIYTDVRDLEGIVALLEIVYDTHPAAGVQLCWNTIETAPFKWCISIVEKLDPAIHGLYVDVLSGTLNQEIKIISLHSIKKTDFNILKYIQKGARSKSLTKTGLFYTISLMSAGTTIDSYLRRNTALMTSAKEYEKTCAYAALGVIHINHVTHGRDIIKNFLENPGSSIKDPYRFAGALFAFGLIYNELKDVEQEQYLFDVMDKLTGPEDKMNVVRYGGCMALGLLGMGLANEAYTTILQPLLNSTDSLVGQMAAVSLGMCCFGLGIGRKTKVLFEQVKLLCETSQQEKVARGCAIAISLILQGTERLHMPLIEELAASKYAVVRYAAVLALGTAFVGTGNGEVLQKLLEIAVSDLSDDVRRQAPISIGLVLCREPHLIPDLVALLGYSHNAHVRAGVALALGYTLAGTGSKAALKILLPLTKDLENFVRQHALIGTALVLQATNKNQDFFDELIGILKNEIEHRLVKFGACVALGLLNAGGCNSVFSMVKETNLKRNIIGSSVMACVVSSQFYYWHQFLYLMPIAFVPNVYTPLLYSDETIRSDVSVKMQLHCSRPESEFAYRKEFVEDVKAVKLNIKKSSLSVEGRVANRKLHVAKIDDEPQEMEDVKEEEEEEKPEPLEYNVTAPCRITVEQSKYITTDVDEKYVPVDRTKKVGIVIVTEFNQ